MSELQHMKQLETKYKDENKDLHSRTDQEGRSNVHLIGQLKDLENKIRAREEK